MATLSAPAFTDTLQDALTHGDYIREAYGIEDPWGKDDSAFPSERVYCRSHCRAHTKGWCTVPNYEKLSIEDATALGYLG